MSEAVDVKAIMARKQAWGNSPAYRDLCALYQSECDRLSRWVSAARVDLEDRVRQAEGAVVSTEGAVNGTIHRGVYCPSPVLDLIVGNVRRGKLLQRVTAKSKLTHQYGFDAAHRLVFSRSISRGEVIATEYLFRQDRAVYGLSLDAHGAVTAVSEELYCEDLPVKYTYAQYLPWGPALTCVDYRSEEYTYEGDVLAACHVRTYHPVAQIHSHEAYRFRHTDGCLSGYTVEEYEGDQRVTGYWDDHVFEIKTKK